MRLRAVHAFTPAPGMLIELPLLAGEIVRWVRQEAPDGWLVVQSLADANKKGLVPQSFLEVVDEDSDDANDAEFEAEATTDDAPTVEAATADRAAIATPAASAQAAAAAAEDRTSLLAHAPAGIFALTPFHRETDLIYRISQLRAKCAARNLPLSISDNWRTLDIR